MLGQLIAVTKNALIESVRQPFYSIWLLVVSLLIVLTPHVAGFTFDDDNFFALELQLSALLTGGLILAAFTAAGVISREIENRTVLTVISKPLPRPTFILGKYLGIVAALVLAWWVWLLFLLLSLRQGVFSDIRVPWDGPMLVFGISAVLVAVGIAAIRNYVFQQHFGATLTRWLAVLLPIALVVTLCFDLNFAPRSPVESLKQNWPVYMAGFFVLQAVFLFAAIATACSARLGQVPTLAICIAIFLLGLSSDFYLGKLAATSGTWWSKALYAITPNLGFHWLADALITSSVLNMTASYFMHVTLYTLLLVTGILGLAVALFQTRQAG